jgi:hypothetical protein
MTEGASHNFPLPAIPAADVVLDDTPCRTCGYNLRMLATSGVCPECATLVRVSVGGGVLRHADPRFLRQLNAGLKLSRLSLGFLIFVAYFSHLSPIVARIVSIAASGGVLLGTWLLAAPDPSGLGEAEYGTLRITTRILGILQFCSLFVTMAAFTASPTGYLIAEIAEFAVQFLWGICMLLYLRRLAKRTWAISAMVSFVWEIMAYLAVLPLVAASILVVPGGLHRMRVLFSRMWLELFFVFSGLTTFSKALRPELAAAQAPTLPRAAGSFLRSIRELFTGGRSSDKECPDVTLTRPGCRPSGCS